MLRLPFSSALIRQLAIGLLCVVILLAVLSMYLRPEFLLTLADQVWGCF
jgi:hypothetical protein